MTRLIKAGADVKGEFNYTALKYASSTGHTELAEYLKSINTS